MVSLPRLLSMMWRNFTHKGRFLKRILQLPVIQMMNGWFRKIGNMVPWVAIIHWMRFMLRLDDMAEMYPDLVSPAEAISDDN